MYCLLMFHSILTNRFLSIITNFKFINSLINNRSGNITRVIINSADAFYVFEWHACYYYVSVIVCIDFM